jgi:hypothetical protein
MTDKISGLLVTGLLAVLGTVVGGVVKGYWDTNLAKMDFQSKLILRALEPEDVEQRVSSLEFLVKANLITSPEIRDGLTGILKEGAQSVPQFQPIGTPTSIGSTGVSSISSARDTVLEKFPTLKGKNIALVGFRVRHGDIIDAVTPIYAEVTKSLQLQGEFEGERIGGTGGGETVLKKPGYVVTGFDVQRGYYFGRQEVVHFQVIWKRLTPKGVDPSSDIVSEKLGGGSYVKNLQPPKEFRANAGAFISDFAATTSFHTSGETFLNDIQISETVVVQ